MNRIRIRMVIMLAFLGLFLLPQLLPPALDPGVVPPAAAQETPSGDDAAERHQPPFQRLLDVANRDRHRGQCVAF